MRTLCYAALGLLLAVSAQAQPDPASTVRVRLFSQAPPSQAEAQVVGQPGRLLVDGVPMAALLPGARLTLSQTGGEVRVRVDGTDRRGRTVDIEAAEIRVRAGGSDHRYPARLAAAVAGGRLQLVNHAPMEPYVASVVASEFGFPVLEGAKAQAVLARTYAARRRGEHAGYDLDDHQGSQVYRGLGPVTPTSRRAATETAGQLLTYRGELADGVYFSSSGGHTADNESVWQGAPVPYLRGVPDPYDAAAPDHGWRTTASRDQVLRALSARFGGRVERVEVAQRSRKGRVMRVRLVGGRTESITGSQLRQAVNAAVGPRTVRSTRYDVASEGDRIVFTGGGFGHGVGMSQYGALEQARTGRSYRQILAYYFLGTDVLGGPAVAPPLMAAQVVGEAVPRRPESALRTRYQPPSGRRWPEPRRVIPSDIPAGEALTDAPAAARPLPARPAPAATPAAAPKRRAAW